MKDSKEYWKKAEDLARHLCVPRDPEMMIYCGIPFQLDYGVYAASGDLKPYWRTKLGEACSILDFLESYEKPSA